MKNSFLHNIVIFATLLLVALCFNFSVNASSKEEINKQQVSSSLIIKSKNAILAGNPKMAENYLDQAKSIDPTLSNTEYFTNENSDIPSDIILRTENDFFNTIKKMPYDKAKIELDKKLLFNPNNSKLRLVYLELAEKNNDEAEADIHRNFLGIKKANVYNIDLGLKYFLIVIVSCLIIYEVIVIFRPLPKSEQPLPTN